MSAEFPPSPETLKVPDKDEKPNRQWMCCECGRRNIGYGACTETLADVPEFRPVYDCYHDRCMMCKPKWSRHPPPKNCMTMWSHPPGSPAYLRPKSDWDMSPEGEPEPEHRPVTVAAPKLPGSPELATLTQAPQLESHANGSRPATEHTTDPEGKGKVVERIPSPKSPDSAVSFSAAPKFIKVEPDTSSSSSETSGAVQYPEGVSDSGDNPNGTNGTNGNGAYGSGANGYGANGNGTNGYGANGNGTNGYGANGNGTNGYGANGNGMNGNGNAPNGNGNGPNDNRPNGNGNGANGHGPNGNRTDGSDTKSVSDSEPIQLQAPSRAGLDAYDQMMRDALDKRRRDGG